MNSNYIINDDNFLLFAAKHYDNPQCFDDEEFFEDLKRIKYMKRLFKKYQETGEIKVRLVLNHLIVLNNLFGPYATSRMLLVKMKGYETYIKPFLDYINILPETIDNINSFKVIHTHKITSDPNITIKLRMI